MLAGLLGPLGNRPIRFQPAGPGCVGSGQPYWVRWLSHSRSPKVRDGQEGAARVRRGARRRMGVVDFMVGK